MNSVKYMRKKFSLNALGRACDQSVHDRMDELIAVYERKALIAGDQNGGYAVNACPQSLADRLGIAGLRKPACGDAVVDRTAKEVEGLHAGRIGLGHAGVIETLRDGHHEDGAIMVRILEAEIDIGEETALEAFDWISRLLQYASEMRGEPGKRLYTDLFEKLGFIFEVEIDGGGGIFDLVGNPTHGDIFVAFFNEKLTGSVEDFLAKEFFLAEFAFFKSHKLLNNVKLPRAFCQVGRI
jgi:hypothetical protein